MGLLSIGTVMVAQNLIQQKDAYAIVSPPPAIISLSPNSGPVAGGTVVTITGSNFSSGLNIFFGSVPGIVQSFSTTQIVATAPANVASTVDVTISEASGIAVLPASYTYIPDNNEGNTGSDECSKQNKVTICHIPPGEKDNPHTLCLPEEAIPAHLSHGDVLGKCPAEKERGKEDLEKKSGRNKDENEDNRKRDQQNS